jgi:hypothetical protein
MLTLVANCHVRRVSFTPRTLLSSFLPDSGDSLRRRFRRKVDGGADNIDSIKGDAFSQ